MTASFFHGAKVFESNETPVLIRLGQSAIVGIIGTANDAVASKFPLNTPVQILGRPTDLKDLGDAGTLKDAIDTVFDQEYCTVIVVRVEAGADTQATWSNIIGDFTLQTGVHAFLKCESLGMYKPRLLMAPGWTTTSPIDGVASVAVEVQGTGYPTAAGATRVAVSGDGTGLTATPVVDATGKVTAVIVNTPGFGFTTAPTLTIEGGGTGVSASPVVAGGVITDILVEVQGEHYSGTPTVTIADGDGSGATLTPVLTGDAVTSVTVTAGGANYSGNATVAFAGDGSGATGTLTVVDGVITAVAVDTNGSGYSSATATVTDGDGSGATAAAIIENGKITGFSVTAGGTDYSGNATITVANAVGTGATVSAYLGVTANPVVAEAAGVAEKLKAIFYADGPDSTDVAAVQYKNVNSFPRVFICDPRILKFDTDIDAYVPRPSSPIFVGDQVRTDRQFGFHHAASNHIVNGIGGTNRPINYGIQSDYLNENRVNTIVNYDGGFRTWGVWLSGGSSLWQFVSVRRVADQVNEAMERAYREFADKPFTKANLKFMVESGNAFLRSLAQQSYILPGAKCWIDPEKNVAEDMAQGIIRLSVRFEPPAPMVQIQITAHRWIASYDLLLDQAIRAIESGSLAAA